MSKQPEKGINTENRTEYNIRQHQKKGEKGVKVKLQVKECKVVILHPSLTCPSIMMDVEPIRIFLITNDNFYNQSQDSVTSRDSSGWTSAHSLRRTIARCVKISTFDDALNHKDDNIKNDKPIFNDTDAVDNIAVKYLGKAGKTNLKNQRGGAAKDSAHNGVIVEEHFEAIIRPDVLKLYAKENLTHLFQVDIHLHIKTGSAKGTLYDISWITYDPKLKLHDNDLLERQDQYTNEFIKNNKYIKDTELTHAFKVDVPTKEFKYEVDKNQPIQNYHPIWIKETTNSNKPFNIGQLTDVHVSSRQHVFKTSKAELIPGSNTNEIGPMVNTSYEALKDLMDQYGDDGKIDLLFFTGDLIDYNRNYHPKKFMKGELSKTGDIWKEMLFENMNQRNADGSAKTIDAIRKRRPRAGKGNQSAGKTYKVILPNNDDYPSSIDNVVMYSLFLYYYKKYKKPIFLISGNHECYSMPYGISPRVKTSRGITKAATTLANQTLEKQVEDSRVDLEKDMKKGKEGTTGGNRANTGVPADHNLTFGEATLMYGPSYHQNITFGKGDSANTQNFKPRNLDWFHTVFTPLSDYVLSNGENKRLQL